MITRNLDQIASREEIKELRAEYNWHIMRGDYEKSASLFTDDGVFEASIEGSEHNCFKGRDAIRNVLKGLPVGKLAVVLNHTIEVTGNEATGTCVMVAPAPPHNSGYYHDDFRRVNGQWRFAARRYFRYHPSFERSGFDIHGKPETGLSAQR